MRVARKREVLKKHNSYFLCRRIRLMERLDELQREHMMLCHLNALPRKIVQLHGIDNATEFVLHDLCQERCLNFNKAAYFVDNPAFNVTQGIAGFSRQEAFLKDDVWHDPKEFSDHMQVSPFNQKVRKLTRNSLMHTDEGHKELAAELAHDLGYAHHDFCTWPIKHTNHGFLVYEKAHEQDRVPHEIVINGLALLSFCPVF
jgi:hypothetical protein